MVIVWISGFCVGTGLAGLLLALTPICVKPDTVASIGMIVIGACAIGVAAAWSRHAQPPSALTEGTPFERN